MHRPCTTAPRATRRAALWIAFGPWLTPAVAAPVAGAPMPDAPMPAPPMPAPLMQLIAGSGLPAASFGVSVREVVAGTALAALNEDQLFRMASTAKLVTSLAALNLLGVNHRTRCHAFVHGGMLNSRLYGDLWIVGRGHASLSAAELKQWFAAMRRQGLAEVQGDIVLDGVALHPDASAAGGAAGAGHAIQRSSEAATAGAAPRTVAALWREGGGKLRGRVLESGAASAIAAPPSEPWSSHESEPLPALIRDMNKRSDNVIARALMASLARPASKPRGAALDPRSRLQAWLRSQGLAAGDITIDAGSGQLRSERGRPQALVTLLRRAWSARHAKVFIDSLPIAGVDGTLAQRLQHGAATGRAFLKTGSLGDTRALAGYVRARSGRVFALALMVEHPAEHAAAARATVALDKLVEWVAGNG